MKLKFDNEGLNRHQPDPFIFEDNGVLYLYVTAYDGVEAYKADSLDGEWQYIGIVTDFAEGKDFWAPSVIKIDDAYYMYVSCNKPDAGQHMHCAKAMSPEGPFTDEKKLYDHFSIDSHMVKTDAGLFLWYAKDNTDCERVGTRIWVDKFVDPYTPENNPKEVIVPTFDEEKFTPQCTAERDWYTIEGPFWFKEGDWQYVMYSGGCYMDDTYHIGYAAAKTNETNHKNIDFIKNTNGGSFVPVIIKNDFEEGTGHHSVIKYNGEYYAIYHGRDIKERVGEGYNEARTARVCRLEVKDGKITAQRYENHM